MRDRILLLGLMGAGKTSVGAAVAASLGWTYVDNDDLLRSRTGLDGATLLAEQGSVALRAAEVAAFRAALDDPEPAVLSVAGGVVLDQASRALVRDGGFVVWLRADPAVLAKRVADDRTRARLGDDPESALRTLAAAREPHYAALADLVLDASSATVNELAEAVVAAVRQA